MRYASKALVGLNGSLAIATIRGSHRTAISDAYALKHCICSTEEKIPVCDFECGKTRILSPAWALPSGNTQYGSFVRRSSSRCEQYNLMSTPKGGEGNLYTECVAVHESFKARISARLRITNYQSE